MMNKKTFLICLVLLLTISLCGCQLAKEDGLEVENDRLIGVFITPEYLDLFDFDSYMQDNISSIMKKGGNITIEQDEKYQGRIYAELKPMIFDDSESDETPEVLEYVFEELEGIPFFRYEVTQTDFEPYSAISSVDYLNDTHLYIGDETSIEGTIYVMPNKGFHAYYTNPVYQSNDGQVYLTAGTGISLSGDTSERAAFTQTLEEKRTITENGEEVEEKFKVTIKIAVKHPTVSINIVQMDAESNIVLSQEYMPDTMPGELKFSKDTSYVIVESKLASPYEEIIKRELLDLEDDYFTNYILDDNGFYQVSSVRLIWGECTP